MFIDYLSKFLISDMKIFGCLLYRKNILSPYRNFSFYFVCIYCCIFYKVSPHCFLIEPVYILNINFFSIFPIETRLVYFSFFKPVFGAFINSDFSPRNNHGDLIPFHLYKKSIVLLFYTWSKSVRNHAFKIIQIWNLQINFSYLCFVDGTILLRGEHFLRDSAQQVTPQRRRRPIATCQGLKSPETPSIFHMATLFTANSVRWLYFI